MYPVAQVTQCWGYTPESLCWGLVFAFLPQCFPLVCSGNAQSVSRPLLGLHLLSPMVPIPFQTQTSFPSAFLCLPNCVPPCVSHHCPDHSEDRPASSS